MAKEMDIADNCCDDGEWVPYDERDEAVTASAAPAQDRPIAPNNPTKKEDT